MKKVYSGAEKFLKDDPSFSASNWGRHAPFLHDKD
jgi:hypothetical protein